MTSLEVIKSSCGEYCYLYSNQRVKIITSISEQDFERAETDVIEFASEFFGVSRSVMESWDNWQISGGKCQALAKSSGKPCQLNTSGFYDISPTDFDPEFTPYCKAHKDPLKRGELWIQRSATPGFVYLIHAKETIRYKIGKTTQITIRESTLQRQSPFPISLLTLLPAADPYRLEAELHNRYATYRVHGEWFELPADAIADICAMELRV